MGEGDLIVDNREDEAGEEEGDEIDFKKIGKTVSLCLSARTALFLPYKVLIANARLLLTFSGHPLRRPIVTTTLT